MKRILQSGLFVAFFILTIPAVSQLPSNWTKLPGGTGKSLRDVVAFSPDTLFALDEEGNILSTFDGGNAWKTRNPQTGKEIKINALRINSSARTIIAVGDTNAVFRSTNMGESWESTYAGSADAPVSFYAITGDGANYDENIVFAVGQNATILKSSNDGIEWEKIEMDAGVTQSFKFVTFLNPDTGFVASVKGMLRTFDGGQTWDLVATGDSISAVKSKRKFKAGKALADEVKLVGNDGGGIQTSTNYGATWAKDSIENSCALLATGGVIFDKEQCENLHKGMLVSGGVGEKGNMLFMLSGSTFQGVLQPKWENVELEGILMVMRRMDDKTIIAETLTESNGRFDLDIPASVSGDVEVVARQAWDQDWCPRTLPFDFDTTLEPMEECDESTLPLRIISPESVVLNDLAFNNDSWITVGNNGVVLRSTDPDDDGDGLPTVWVEENSRTNEDLFAATARGIEKSDIRRGFYAAGNAGTIVASQTPEFELVAPTKTDSLCAGTEITISWNGGDPTWNVVVSIIDVNSWAVAAVVNPNTLNDGNETWNIPPNFAPGLYQAYVQEVNYITWAYGDVFTIKSCPNQPGCITECENNLVQNHNFNVDATYGPMPIGATADWVRSWSKTMFINGYHGESPDVSASTCDATDTVSIGMWGNHAIGESMEQVLSVPFSPGKAYAVSFTARWMPSFNRPYPVQFEFKASTAPLTSPGDGTLIGISDPITTPGQWVTLSLPEWVAPASNHVSGIYTMLTVGPTNQSSAIHPDSTSYGQIGTICITEKDPTNAHSLSNQDCELGQSFPNPFENSTVIEYSLSRAEKVTLKIYDLYGKEIETLVDKVVESGTHRAEWNATGLPAGIYLYRIQAGNFADTKRTILVE
ncbi:T9SS C-terminal target domain-containing protein [Mariniphaga sediminis]|uniref:T9SS C-terminal target domain-containing protein n=1 Tax=Mariniphaga sediminis TaxID=1628158 RepID=A0A399D4Z7_9BACT|nr:T9SS type A sorting domain-containing protein [Mariniphaga sediminis]RIH64214.1 T9SS C-terminal target domain-containing protein [Mariniphaga sediminis]RIH66493.1 T9SS C-terminal target domain-containing protein [Mariniphaga sediminis]